MMGQEARRLDLWSDLAGVKPAGSSLLASSSRLSSPRERSGWPVRASSCVLLLPVVKRPPRSSDRQNGHGRGLPTEAERRPVAPHPVQDDSELAGACDTGPRHASCLGDLDAPGAQGRPLAAAYEERMGCFVESSTGELVAASADPADDVRLAGLIAVGVSPRWPPTSREA